MSSDKGIFRVSKQDLKDFDEGKRQRIRCISYGKADGMKSSKCAGGGQPAAWKTKDGELWFPTSKGIVIIDPGKIKLNSVIPPVIIEKIKIDDRLMAPKQHIEISPGTRRLEFHYTAASFAAPKKIKFKYKLEGFDKEWMDAGSSAGRVAGYTNIPPGTYCFRVIACNNDGLWNEKGASFYFKLNPFFYQTSWFYGLCILAVLALGSVFHRLRVKQILIKERKKYEKARLPSEYADKYLEKLLQFMKDDKPYLDSEISLQGLSKRLAIPEHHLSQVINERLNRNFYNFINHYRLEEAKRILTDPGNRLTIIEIAFQVGFNSKSAFNRAFKQHTNMTPSDFKKKQNKQKDLKEDKAEMGAKLLEQPLNIVQ
jgi:AraC-like DNA-binding protein